MLNEADGCYTAQCGMERSVITEIPIERAETLGKSEFTYEPEKGSSSLKVDILEDGGGIGRGDHFLFYKFIERTTER